jgi:hypothetical protein
LEGEIQINQEKVNLTEDLELRGQSMRGDQ